MLRPSELVTIYACHHERKTCSARSKPKRLPNKRLSLRRGWPTVKWKPNISDFKNSGKDDPATWSKALSSFGNTEGGLIVWGIDARSRKGPNPDDRAVDCACELKPLKDTRQHVQLLKDILRDSTNETDSWHRTFRSAGEQSPRRLRCQFCSTRQEQTVSSPSVDGTALLLACR